MNRLFSCFSLTVLFLTSSSVLVGAEAFLRNQNLYNHNPSDPYSLRGAPAFSSTFDLTADTETFPLGPKSTEQIQKELDQERLRTTHHDQDAQAIKSDWQAVKSGNEVAWEMQEKVTLCQMAYKDLNSDDWQNFVSKESEKGHKVHVFGTSYEAKSGYVLEKQDGQVSIVFKGTNSVDNAITDANFFWKKDLALGITAHRGFINHVRALSPQLTNILEEITQRTPTKLQLSIYGHSLGAATAHIAAWDLFNRAEITDTVSSGEVSGAIAKKAKVADTGGVNEEVSGALVNGGGDIEESLQEISPQFTLKEVTAFGAPHAFDAESADTYDACDIPTTNVYQQNDPIAYMGGLSPLSAASLAVSPNPLLPFAFSGGKAVGDQVELSASPNAHRLSGYADSIEEARAHKTLASKSFWSPFATKVNSFLQRGVSFFHNCATKVTNAVAKGAQWFKSTLA